MTIRKRSAGLRTLRYSVSNARYWNCTLRSMPNTAASPGFSKPSGAAFTSSKMGLCVSSEIDLPALLSRIG